MAFSLSLKNFFFSTDRAVLFELILFDILWPFGDRPVLRMIVREK